MSENVTKFPQKDEAPVGSVPLDTTNLRPEDGWVNLKGKSAEFIERMFQECAPEVEFVDVTPYPRADFTSVVIGDNGQPVVSGERKETLREVINRIREMDIEWPDDPIGEMRPQPKDTGNE